MPAETERHEAALEWVRKIADPEFADWPGHLAWLEADPRNLAAFDQASVLIEDALEGLSPIVRGEAGEPAPPVNDNIAVARPRKPRWGWLSFGGSAIAASLTALIALQPHAAVAPQIDRVATGAGELRTVTLPDGSRIALNGDTILSYDRAKPRAVRLERGEAFFSIAHDAGKPFSVRAGDAVFQDVATAFDVKHGAGSTEIAVREGAVLYDPDRAAVKLGGGQAMRIAQGTATVRSIDPAAAGAWQDGRLNYSDAPLNEIAADLQRRTGIPIRVEQPLQERRFSGVIVMDRDKDEMMRRLAAVLEVRIRRERQGWRMEAPAR